jgi:lactoylglutathione lyase
MISLAYTILYVKDVTKSIEFYEQAFGLSRKFITPDNTYGELETGATTLSFASIEFAKSNLKTGFIENNPDNLPFAQEIGFTTDNVEETVKGAVDAGAVLAVEAQSKPWGQVVAYLRDPDGFLIEICTPVSA